MQEGAQKSPTTRAALGDWADDLVLICESMVFVFVVSPMVLNC
jgi:hypothetical protein